MPSHGAINTSKNDPSLELERRTSLAFTLGVVMLVSLGWFYKDYFYSIAQLMLDKDYGYLGVAIVTVFTTLYFSLKQVGFAYGISVKRALVGIYLTLVSLIFYASAMIDPRYLVQYLGLSFSFLFLAFISTILSPVYARDLIPLLSILLLVPPPPGWMDRLTPHLSRIVGELASALTGARLVGGPGYTTLIVTTPSGPVRFIVEYACTGIVTMSSILVVVPVVLYLLTYSPASTWRKAIASIAALVTALVLGFLGNLVRVLLVIYGTRWLGPEKGLALFHYSPSIIYAIVSVLAGFYLADKIGGLRLALPRLKMGRVLSRPEAVMGALVLIIVLASFFIVGVNAVFYSGSSGSKALARTGIVVTADNPTDFIDNPEKYIKYNSNISMVILGEDRQLTRLLNAFVVYRVIIKYKNISYLGYMEIVDTPGRLHTWQLCLSLQGYKIENSYTKIANGTPIYFITMRKHGQGYLLGYTLIPTRVKTPQATYELYTRVSLIATYSNKTKTVSESTLATILAELWRGAEATTNKRVDKLIKYYSIASYALLLLILAYEAAEIRRKGVIGRGL